jgi:hypothetical protein
MQWRAATRQVVTFLLGVYVIVDALLDSRAPSVGKLIVGLILIGVTTSEDLVRLLKRPASRPLPARRRRRPRSDG